MHGSPLDDLRAARREFDDVVAEIRAVPGYRDFLTEPRFDDIARAATDQPLCYLAAADDGGSAFVVRDGEVDHVALPGLGAPAVHDAVSAHLGGYHAFRASGGAAFEGWAADLDARTGWLWDAVMGPVLDRIGAVEEITVVAGGLLGLLPLHAAWCPDSSTATGRHYAVDSAAISYVPNARSLTTARERAARAGYGKALVVADPTSTGLEPLPSARFEAMAMSAGSTSVLAGSDATADRVRDGLRTAEVLHFACHGIADLLSPVDSRLALADGESLTLRDLLALKVTARLAVLSACETAMPGTDLPDEALGLPMGLLQAGAAGVVASLWAVHDLSTTMLMVEFHRRWAGGELSPAQALRQAQRWVRDSTNAEKASAWRAAEGLPAELVEHLDDELSLREPRHRDESPVHAWAAFQHIGA